MATAFGYLTGGKVQRLVEWACKKTAGKNSTLYVVYGPYNARVTVNKPDGGNYFIVHNGREV